MTEVQSWPLEEQLEFVFDLWDGIMDRGVRPKPTPELLAELRRRVAKHDLDPSRALTWEQVVDSIRETS